MTNRAKPIYSSNHHRSMLDADFISELDPNALLLLQQRAEKTLALIKAKRAERALSAAAKSATLARLRQVRRDAIRGEKHLPKETIAHYQRQLLRERRQKRLAARNARFLTLYAQGWPIQRIADTYNVAHSTVWRVIKKAQPD